MDLMAVRRVTTACVIAMVTVVIYLVSFRMTYRDGGDLAIAALLFSGVYTVAWISINHRDEQRRSGLEHAAHEVDVLDQDPRPAQLTN